MSTRTERLALFALLGLDDGKTPPRLSFNKGVTVFGCLAFGVLVGLMVWFVMATKTWPPVTIVACVLSFGIVLIGAGFGLKGYLGGLQQKAIVATATATETVNATLTGDLNEIAKTVLNRRDPVAGVEATGQVPVLHHD